jgi:hypothetical protein
MRKTRAQAQTNTIPWNASLHGTNGFILRWRMVKESQGKTLDI